MAAGFAPLAVGSEAIGSLINPSTRAGLYALKPTQGVQDTGGAYFLTGFFDSPGPMAKSADDLVDLAEIMLNWDFTHVWLDWTGLTVGFVHPWFWKLEEHECSQFEGTAEQMASRLPQHHNSCIG